MAYKGGNMKSFTVTMILALFLGAWAPTSAGAFAPEEPEDSLTQRRNLIICYDIKNYDSRIRQTVVTIFNHLVRKGDNLIVYSPAKVYGFSQKTLSRPKRELITWLQDRLKSDCTVADAAYRQSYNELSGLVQELINENASTTGMDAKSILLRYKQGMESLQALRRIEQPLLLKFAGMFRQTPGRNHVIVFFQKELRPIPDGKAMDTLMNNVNLAFTASEVFVQPSPQKSKEQSQAVIDAFRAVGATLHFAYLKLAKGMRPPRRMDHQENSVDMYGFFSKLANETGGIKMTTANPEEMMKAFRKRLEE